MTDPIEFEDEVDLPPTIIDDPEYPSGSIITFKKVEGGTGEVRINLKIDDENIGQVLKLRTVITRATGVSVYTCPEPNVIVGSLPSDWPLVIDESKLSAGECHKVELAVSAHFLPCQEEEDLAARLFDQVETAHSDDLARATFWIWETSANDLFNDPAATQALVQSCKAVEYSPASTTPP